MNDRYEYEAQGFGSARAAGEWANRMGLRGWYAVGYAADNGYTSILMQRPIQEDEDDDFDNL